MSQDDFFFLREDTIRDFVICPYPQDTKYEASIQGRLLMMLPPVSVCPLCPSLGLVWDVRVLQTVYSS